VVELTAFVLGDRLEKTTAQALVVLIHDNTVASDREPGGWAPISVG
jgi:hypothetical protein